MVAPISGDLFILLAMEKTYNITWLILILLTTVAILLSKIEMANASIIVLGLSFLKFVGVAFYFMELKNANVFWKVLLVVFLAGLLTTIVLI